MKSQIKMVLILLIFICPAKNLALTKPILPKDELRYGINYWREAEGLPQSRIRAITQTRDGYLWLGTDNGVVRFNGTSFTAFSVETGSLKDNEVWALLEDNEGGLWIGTYGGGLTLLRDGHFTSFNRADGLPADIITQLDMDLEGNIWVSTTIGIFRYSKGQFTYFTPGDGLPNYSITAICAHSPDGVLVAEGNKLYRFLDGKFNLTHGIVEDDDGVIEHLFSGRDNSLWLSFSNAVIKHWKDGEITTYTLKNNLTTHITSIYEDADGTFWAALENGLNKLKDGKFLPVSLGTSANELGVIYSLFGDREGNLWLGLQANGLGRLHITELSTISTDDGLNNDSTRAVFEDSQKTLWIGTANGFSTFRQGTITNYTDYDGTRLDSIRSFAEDNNGNIWIAAGKSLLLMKKGKLTKFPLWNSKFEIKVIYKDKQGIMWIGTDGDGLFRYENGKFDNFHSPDGLAGNNIRAILSDHEGALWVSCTGNGLTKHSNGRFTNYTTLDGLAGNRGLALYEDDEGTLWIPTREGLSRFKDGKFFNYTAESGLFVGFIYNMLDDGKGSFWFSCAKGLFRVSKTELKDFADGKRQSVVSIDYGVRDGMKTRAFNLGNQPAATKTADGSLIFCSLKGLVIVDPSRIHSSDFIPPVYIEAAAINRENQPLNGESQLPVGTGEVEIHFAALSYLAPEKLRFKYILEGYDKEWVDAGTRRFAYYANLSPGQYRFRVIAGNVGGAWNAEGASYDFYLPPHFYQTRLFLALMIVVLILTAALLYRLRMLGLKARYTAVLAERNRIAIEIHDTLAQNLAGIALQLDSVTMQLSDIPDGLRESVKQACSLTRYSLSEARRAVTDLRSDELENQEFAEILPVIANKLTNHTNIQANIEITGVPRKLNLVTEKNLLRIFQEAVANAVKHSQASTIEIELKYGIKSLTLRITDDGKGFNTEKIIPLSIGHYGLIGMRERAARFGGQLTLTSKPGQGTELVVELCFSNETKLADGFSLEQ